MKKLSARWRMVFAHYRAKASSYANINRFGIIYYIELFIIFIKNRTGFMRHFVTMAETWIHHYTPESKTRSKQ